MKLLTVKQVAEKYKVSETAVRMWVEKGLPYKTEKVIGIKPRMVISETDIESFLNVGIQKQ